MKTIYLSALVISCFYVLPLQAQTYNLQEIESSFIQNNFNLIAKKYQIAESEAFLVQEKLLPNPTLSISEFNLWKNSSSEQLPYLFRKYGQTQQISVELEQLIETAQKRKKRLAIKQNEVKQSVFEFEELLRELKKELRITYWDLLRIKETQKQTQKILELYQQLNEQYTKQANLKNVSQADAYRVQTAFLNLQAANADLLNEQAQLLLVLKQLTQIENLQVSQIVYPKIVFDLSVNLPLNLLESIGDNHIGLKIQSNRLDLAQKQLDLEVAQRVPDLNFQINYDRGGSIMRDFVGVGLRVDLPVFNRNKGNINAAKQNIDQQKNIQKALLSQVENQSNFALIQLLQFEKLLKESKELKYENIETLLTDFYKHLQNKQITLFEFIDFSQAHLEAQEAYYQWMIQYFTNYEQLQYLVGKDF